MDKYIKQYIKKVENSRILVFGTFKTFKMFILPSFQIHRKLQNIVHRVFKSVKALNVVKARMQVTLNELW